MSKDFLLAMFGFFKYFKHTQNILIVFTYLSYTHFILLRMITTDNNFNFYLQPVLLPTIMNGHWDTLPLPLFIHTWEELYLNMYVEYNIHWSS